MKFIEGQLVKNIVSSLDDLQLANIFHQIGKWVALMHHNNHTHGDLTTSNIIITPTKELFFIDFGLSQRDIGIEEKAMDIHLFKRVLLSTHGNQYDLLYSSFINGYSLNINENLQKILRRIEIIELRGRYIPKDQRRNETPSKVKNKKKN